MRTYHVYTQDTHLCHLYLAVLQALCNSLYLRSLLSRTAVAAVMDVNAADGASHRRS